MSKTLLDQPSPVVEARITRADAPEVPAAPTSDLLGMFERMVRDPQVDVEKLERLMQMHERATARIAEERFYAAMAEAQKEMRPIATDSHNKQTNSRFASYLALDAALRPIYTKHGFGLSFDTGDAPAVDIVRVLCDVSHVGGHKRTYKLDMPADGKGAKGGDVMTRTHATGAAARYGMRYLLNMIFNVAIGEADDDGNGAGREIPEMPDGFQVWWDDLKSLSESGTEADLKRTWTGSKREYREYLVTYYPEKWDALKAAANKRGRS